MSDDLKIVCVPKDLYYHEIDYVRGLEARIAALEAALQSIANKCPATCDMTLAHEMAQEAGEALVVIGPVNSVVPCYRGGHSCNWPACSPDCEGRPGKRSYD
jgi:hypothetical protein